MPSQIQLTSVGRRSGRSHRVTLYAYPDGDNLVVVGSAGGRSRDPDWVANLRATSSVTVRHGKEEAPYTAHEATDKERMRLWSLVTKSFPLYQTYQARTERIIPLFVLERGS